MPLTPTAERVGPYSVRYTWSGTAPYDVWVNGELVLNQTTDTTTVIQFPGEAVPHAVEVLDATDTGMAESLRYSPRLRLQWRGHAGVEHYRVQTYADSAWSTQQIASEDGRGYYTYTTIAQADATSAQWRVIPVDERGYEGEPVAFTFYVVRNPAPPAVDFSYNAGTGNLTVSAS